MMFAVALLSLIGSASAACDNHCSGHGTCTTDDVCSCYDNWGVGLSRDTGDCSDRICPFEIAWVDQPALDGSFHKYLECSGRGICQRDTGECACFDGYEGKGCQRSSCPNDCSGHGTCEYIEDLTYGATWNDYSDYGFSLTAKTFSYRNWDRHKERMCVCDPSYGDFDCSKRMCPYGNDVLDVRDNQAVSLQYQVQQIFFQIPKVQYNNEVANDVKTFALSFKSKLNETFTTYPIRFQTQELTDFANDIKIALLKLPNKVVDDCAVTVSAVSVGTSDSTHTVSITFTGDAVQGNQHLMIVHADQCSDGCNPKVTGLPIETRAALTGSAGTTGVKQSQAADYNSYECGRRGKCDYTTGLCKCFSGYTGENCNTLHALF